MNAQQAASLSAQVTRQGVQIAQLGAVVTATMPAGDALTRLEGLLHTVIRLLEQLAGLPARQPARLTLVHSTPAPPRRRPRRRGPQAKRG